MSSGTITMTGAEYDALAGKIAALEAELAKLRAGQEPVLYVNGEHLALMLDNPDKEGRSASASTVKGHYCDTPLYTTHQPSAVSDGEQLASLLESMRLDDGEAKPHGSGATYWNNAVFACQAAIRAILAAAPSDPQPSAVPDAITMADVMRAWEYAEDHPHKYLRGTTNWCAAVAHSLNQRNPSAPATVQADGWIPVSERLPESERTVLAFYLNSHGKGRRVRAEYIAAKTKPADDGWDSDEPADYDEQADEYFWPAGWYEVMDNWDDLTHMVIHEGEVTHWMPLPESPSIAAARKGE